MNRGNRSSNLLSGIRLNIFSNDELDAIHNATLEILNNTGLRIESKEAVEVFHSAGANVEKIDEESTLVKIPPYLVEDCIRSTPSRVIHRGRDPEKDFVDEPGRVSYTHGMGYMQINDIDTRKIRETRKKDIIETTILADYYDELETVSFGTMPRDIPTALQPVTCFEAVVSNTTKPIHMSPQNVRNLQKVIEMAIAVVGGKEKFKERPLFTCSVMTQSPLIVSKVDCEITMEAAKWGLCINSTGMPLAGTVSPVTLAGSIAQANAEALSMIILSQLINKGNPCYFMWGASLSDLKTLAISVGSPEHGLCCAAGAQLAQYYQIPTFNITGIGDSKEVDIQSGYESGYSRLIGALAGANIIIGAGEYDQLCTLDYAKLALDAENIRMINRMLKGIEVTNDTLALDVINQVGPGGEFLTHEHTYTNLNRVSKNKLFDRNNRGKWKSLGSKNIIDEAYEEARYIINNHKPKPLPVGVAEELRAIIEDYGKELGVQ